MLGRNIHNDFMITVRMSQTVDGLQNEIRTTVGRYERIESTGFTKEALAVIYAAIFYEIDTNDLPVLVGSGSLSTQIIFPSAMRTTTRFPLSVATGFRLL